MCVNNGLRVGYNIIDTHLCVKHSIRWRVQSSEQILERLPPPPPPPSEFAMHTFNFTLSSFSVGGRVFFGMLTK